MGFIIGHFLLLLCIVGFVMPRWLDIFIIPERRDDWKQPTAPCVLRDTREADIADGLEFSSPGESIKEAKPDAAIRGVRNDQLANDVLGEGDSPLFPDVPKRQI